MEEDISADVMMRINLLAKKYRSVKSLSKKVDIAMTIAMQAVANVTPRTKASVLYDLIRDMEKRVVTGHDDVD
ncbi:MAG: hypothetical protein AB7T49_00310 [Oligoflexales bacterium]